MICKAVDQPTIDGVLKNSEKYQPLYAEFPPFNHLDGNDPPLFMWYTAKLTLSSENPGHGIHHPVLGVKMKEKSAWLDHECHLLINVVSQSENYAIATKVLMSKLPTP